MACGWPRCEWRWLEKGWLWQPCSPVVAHKLDGTPVRESEGGWAVNLQGVEGDLFRGLG